MPAFQSCCYAVSCVVHSYLFLFTLTYTRQILWAGVEDTITRLQGGFCAVYTKRTLPPLVTTYASYQSDVIHFPVSPINATGPWERTFPATPTPLDSL
jgi:hypothetical protein